MPSVNEKGIKSYILLGYKPTSNWRIETKYSIAWYLEEESIGGGQEKVQGNPKSTLNLQLIYRF